VVVALIASIESFAAFWTVNRLGFMEAQKVLNDVTNGRQAVFYQTFSVLDWVEFV
jgi:hypothetical protein